MQAGSASESEAQKNHRARYRLRIATSIDIARPITDKAPPNSTIP